MNKVDFIPNDKGAFVMEENGERIAEMIVGISGNNLSVYHTGVEERLQGQGLGKKLVEALASHARENNLKVIIYCPFVKAMFKDQAEQYADIWDQESDQQFQKLK